VLLLMVAAGIYGMFEFGRYSAGFDSLDAYGQRQALRGRSRPGGTISDLRAKVAQTGIVHRRADPGAQEVQRTIGDLQAQVGAGEPGIGVFGDRHAKCELGRGKKSSRRVWWQRPRQTSFESA